MVAACLLHVWELNGSSAVLVDKILILISRLWAGREILLPTCACALLMLCYSGVQASPCGPWA